MLEEQIGKASSSVTYELLHQMCKMAFPLLQKR